MAMQREAKNRLEAWGSATRPTCSMDFMMGKLKAQQAQVNTSTRLARVLTLMERTPGRRRDEYSVGRRVAQSCRCGIGCVEPAGWVSRGGEGGRCWGGLGSGVLVLENAGTGIDWSLVTSTATGGRM